MTSPASDFITNKQTKNIPMAPRRDVAKYEFIEGNLVTKPAANRWHNLIAANFVVAIGSRVHRGTCEVYPGGMQVRVGKNSVCFPDVVVVNGEPAFGDANGEILQNPTVLIEIFSSSSKSPIHTQKLEGFLAVPEIKDFLLVNENEMRIEHYSRQNAKTWMYRIYDEREDMIAIDSIGCKLALSEVYAQVKLASA
jgi:Uma2 family endonuclease